MASPEPWLRGPLPGLSPLLQPAAHALIMSAEDIEAATAGLTAAMLWQRPGGVASIGFHLFHLVGATDRLLTYARGEELTSGQRERLAQERDVDRIRPDLESLQVGWHDGVEAALNHFRQTSESALLEPRFVGRARLPSTVLGLLFHTAEHASRHTGQVVTTSRVVRAEP